MSQSESPEQEFIDEAATEIPVNASMGSEALSEKPVEGSDEGDFAPVSEQDGVIIEKGDRSLFELFHWYTDGRLQIEPEWQRNYVWDVKRASRLIESFLMDIPVPVIYLSRNDQENYEVIDGVQRLTSIFKFFNDEYRLNGLEFLKLEKLSYKQLEAKLQRKLQSSLLRTFELSPKTSKNLLFVIFNRLNSGGVALNEMEIRNCIFTGPLNDLIKQLAATPDFISCVNTRNIEKRMLDRGLVLRFLAFYERHYTKAQSGLKSFLNEFLDTYRAAKQEKLDEFEKVFTKSIKATKTIFGDHAFRSRRDDKNGGGSWASRVNASIFQVVAVSFTAYDLSELTRRADLIEEEFLDLLASDPVWVDAVSKSTGDPSRIKYAFEEWFARLDKCMEGSAPNDKKRCFSRQLKLGHFKDNQTCKICGQAIRLLDDSAMDHELHYWRGFKTIPSNARLVHRHCNLTRSKNDALPQALLSV
jgi:hypothetical protein